MSEQRDPLAAFDAGLTRSVADDAGLSPDRLRELVGRHQQSVRDNPGVDDIVYEWRNYFHRDPVLERTDAAYYLQVRDHVWDEFAESLDLTDDERAALVAVHRKQVRAGTAVEPAGDDPLLVLGRP
ncbi:hypothetical protein BRC83_07560 [Halobacteriales archaeon QS_1_68_17]|nr:MAG: hypothetical protein BRC83_07560 [Halobacteriales archaeon QS_1_68_17]